MIKSKFFKILWAINGVLLLIALLFVTYKNLKKFSFNGSYRKHETGAIVGDLAERAKKIDFELQHLMYDSPQKIKNSDYYLMEIIVLDKEMSDDVKETLSKANDISIRMIGAPVNVVFYNSDRSEVNKLLDSYGYIKRIDFPRENRFYSYQNDEVNKRDYILYELSFNDTNEDGRINEKDSSAFFISDLSGKNLKQITPFSLAFDKYTFSNDYNEIYFEILDKDLQKDVLGYYLKSRKIYFYNVKNDKLYKFKELDEILGSVQKIFKL